MLKATKEKSKSLIFSGVILLFLVFPMESFSASNPQEAGFNALFSNNVRILHQGVPPLIKPDTTLFIDNSFNNVSACNTSNPVAYARRSFSDFHARFSASDLICPSFGGLKVGNINPSKELESYYWKDGYTKLVFKFSVQAQYKGRGYVQPVLEFYRRNWNGNNKYALYIAPLLFDEIDLSNPEPSWLFYDGACDNGCTGRPIFTGWFGDRNNPYMEFGDGQRCPPGNKNSITSCQLSNAQLILTKDSFQKMLDALVALGRFSKAEALAEDWFLGGYAFNVEMPADFGASPEPGSPVTEQFNAFIDFRPTGVVLSATQ
ncbi:MAG: hypothetical protein LBI35_09490 [Burkholderiales bacterium]|jgi:hypothetical protein|nr:hypothetical protein [Burkholderiales bacterium]